MFRHETALLRGFAYVLGRKTARLYQLTARQIRFADPLLWKAHLKSKKAHAHSGSAVQHVSVSAFQNFSFRMGVNSQRPSVR